MQNIKLSPGRLLKNEIKIPGDKSISHRIVILASIHNGITHIHNFLFSEDCIATINALRMMGVKIQQNGNVLTVYGVGLYGLQAPSKPLNLGNSGTSIRLLAGLLAAQKFDSVLIGDESLSKRPMARVVEPLRFMGANIQMTSDNTAPLKIFGNQKLTVINYSMPVASAQVKSALLLAGLYAKGEMVIQENILTRDHTERMISIFNLALPCNYGIQNELTYQVPCDLSSAAFFIVAATINSDADIILKNIGINPYRTGIITLLKMMGADIELINEHLLHNEPVADIRVRSAKLKGITIPSELIAAAIDEFPVLFIAAACAEGITLLKNATELRVKESDRITVMAEGLQKLGIKVETFADGLQIEGGVLLGGTVASYGDHRVAMAFAIAGTVAKASVIIENCSAIATSFPDFINQAQELGINIEYDE